MRLAAMGLFALLSLFTECGGDDHGHAHGEEGAHEHGDDHAHE